MTRPQSQEVKVWLALSLLGIAMYLTWPRLDLWVAAWFYTPGVGFEVADWPGVHTWHIGVSWVGRILLLGCIVLLTVGRSWLSVSARRRTWSLGLGLLLGVGLLVNGVFKEQWGRARPNQIVEFGASQSYSSPLVPSTGCETNCSFVSGHAATGFVLMSVGALAATRTRRRWLLIGWSAGLLLGLVRMAQGGHFLGDVVFGGLMLWACAWLTRWAYVRWRALRRVNRKQSS